MNKQPVAASHMLSIGHDLLDVVKIMGETLVGCRRINGSCSAGLWL